MRVKVNNKNDIKLFSMTIDNLGRLVIPMAIRLAYNIQPYDIITLEIKKGVLNIVIDKD